MTRRALKTIEQRDSSSNNNNMRVTTITITTGTATTWTTTRTTTTRGTTTTGKFKLCPLFVAALIHQLDSSPPVALLPVSRLTPLCQVPFKVLPININIIFYCLHTTRRKSMANNALSTAATRNAQLATRRAQQYSNLQLALHFRFQNVAQYSFFAVCSWLRLLINGEQCGYAGYAELERSLLI